MQWETSIRVAVRTVSIASVLFFSGFAWSAEPPKPAPEPEQEMVIVKYGSVLVKSSLVGARVYIDDTYKGSAESVIESVITGEHVIICKTDDKSVSGTFQVKKNETLKLEANFETGKLALFKVPVPEPVEKKKPEPVKQEKPKTPAPEPKKVEQKNPVEERRKAHLNVMKLEFVITDAQDIKIEHKENPQVISKLTLEKHSAGKYYRTKQGVLLCDVGLCEMTWNSSFLYTDETGKADALLLSWKETVFNGITPTGTNRRDLECCLNGQCWKMQPSDTGEVRQFDIGGRYVLSWDNGSIIIRRADILNEIVGAGRSLSDY